MRFSSEIAVCLGNSTSPADYILAVLGPGRAGVCMGEFFWLRLKPARSVSLGAFFITIIVF